MKIVSQKLHRCNSRSWLSSACLLLVASVLASGTARAEMILVENSGLIHGRQSQSFEFFVPSTGTLTMQLADLVWPSAFQSLTASLTTSTSLLGALAQPGTLTWRIDTAGTFFAVVSGVAAGEFQLGLASLQIGFQPDLPAVPLPAGLWLLLSGLTSAGLLARRAQRRKRIRHV